MPLNVFFFGDDVFMVVGQFKMLHRSAPEYSRS